MIRTISVSDYIQIQGKFVRALNNGNIVVSTGMNEFEGRPLKSALKHLSKIVLAVSKDTDVGTGTHNAS